MINKTQIFSFLHKRHLFIIAFVVFLQLLLIFWGVNHRVALFEDELWSFNLANSYYFPMFNSAKDYFNVDLTGDFFHHLLTVSSDHRFSYPSVLSNLYYDSHPPLYYLYLHSFCSFFPEMWGKWLGVIANIPFFLGTQVVLYLLAKKFSLDDYRGSVFALFVCILYGFSIGAINTAVIVRMQMMMTFFVTAAILINVIIIEKVFCSEGINRYLAVLFLVYLAGVSTQYLVTIPLFFASLLTVFIIYFAGGIKKAVSYALVALSSVCFLFVIFPTAITHIFLGQSRHARAAASSIFSEGFSRHFRTYLNFFTSDEYLLMYLLLGIALILVFFLTRIIKIKIIKPSRKIEFQFSWFENATYNVTLKKELLYWILLVLTAICSIAVIAKIAVYRDTRYIMHLYPIALLSVLIVLFWIAKITKFNLALLIVLISCLFLYRTNLNLKVDNIKWRGNEFKNPIELIEKGNFPENLIYVHSNANWWPTIEFTKFFTTPKTVRMSTVDKFDEVELSQKEYFLIITKWAKSKGAFRLDKLQEKYPQIKIKRSFSSNWGDGFILTQ